MRSELESHGRPIVCVDLNGVLDSYHGWRGETHWDAPRPGAREFLQQLKDRGYDVIVFTSRWHEDARDWLARHGLIELVSEVTDRKPAAHVFVDDRAVRFEGDFDATLREIQSFSAHWERS